jgi:hypothetical protein
MEIPRTEKKYVRAISLLYHDVIKDGNCDSSGFSGVTAARYKLNSDEFQAHCEAVASVLQTPPATVPELVQSNGGTAPVMLTFDDGGASATYVADILERYGWHGHFFITTSRIGKTGFVTEDQIRNLRARGHVIGTHSWSHPERMSFLTWEQLMEEWRISVQSLSNILGEAVTTASVPGGYYSQKVAESAASSGIRALFTSEPITKCRVIRDCLVFGRYTIWRGMPARVGAGFASGSMMPCVRQWLFWNSKKCGKTFAGPLYSMVRTYVAERTSG